MSDYIKRKDAEKILACVLQADSIQAGYEAGDVSEFMGEAKAWMNDAPSADVEPVIRCEDCKKAETVNCPMWRAHFGYTDMDYCSCGVPKE